MGLVSETVDDGDKQQAYRIIQVTGDLNEFDEDV
jgi:hypothetical protein